MRMGLPEVFTVDAHIDVFEWPNQLSSLTHFAKFAFTQDDLKKTEQYQSRAKFVRERKEVVDEVSYLKSIQLKPATQPITPASVSRAEQLCAKTNQFNLRTIRHTASDLQLLAQNNADFCFLTSLSDVYGDHGIVGLVCLREVDEQTLFLDTFLQSCRTLGRHLESWMLQHVVNIGQRYGYTTLIGEFIPSKRNKIAADFFEVHGFERLNDTFWPGSGADSLVKIQDESVSSGSTLFFRSLSKAKLPFVDIYEKY
jgi:FkbH-like protein